MKVLVIGGGGREHALCWKIAQNPLVDALYCAPGNPGIAQVAHCVDVGVDDLERLAAFASDKRVDLTVVGPENPLAGGIADVFQESGLRVFGPTKAAARIEGSKHFAKALMAEAGIPTAGYRAFSDSDDAKAYVREAGAPVVVKADGLAAGKGVTVAQDVDTALEAVDRIMVDRAFGEAGAEVVIEECLVGEEASIFALSDGVDHLVLASSQDHKPVFDNDEGPNTGGMGAYSPAPVVTSEVMRRVEYEIIAPCIRAMAERGEPYQGVLYAGLMITDAGPKVVEFNCRFGDPETQVVLPQMQSDLVPLLLACCDGTLVDQAVAWRDGACATVVMASGGYPGPYEKGKVITGIEDAEGEDVFVFHAGTVQKDATLVTNGGRVLNVTAVGADIPSSIDRAYEAVEKIHFDGAHYRRDIGQKALKHVH